MAFSIRTDMAKELREINPDTSGVEENNEQRGEIELTRIRLVTDEAAEHYGKQKGNYITIEAPELANRPLELFEEVSDCIKEELTKLLGDINENSMILVVGLGNRDVTPDALGPRVIEKVYVTRHIKQLLPEALDSGVCAMCAIAPGVLGVTGIETLELIRGAVKHVKPDVVIAVDALASRRAARISTSVQLSDTGISPGSGVGNKRSGISFETLGCKVIAIGVPLVVYAATVVKDTLDLMADELGKHEDEQELKSLAEQVISAKMGEMIMTPKDIDVMVEDMSGIIADGINKALYKESYDSVMSLTT